MKALKIKSKLIQLLALLEHQTNMYQTPVIYIPNNLQILSIFIISDLYLRTNKSFVRDLSETGYSQQDKVPAPDNIKPSLSTQIEKIEYAFINVKSLTVAHENFFSYDNQNITEVYELNENISIYGLIAILGKANNKDNKLHLITPEHKVKFNLKKDTFKNKIVLKLGIFHTKTAKCFKF